MRNVRRSDAPPRKGGRLCLDYVNTVSWRTSSHPIEWLHTYHDLLSWCQAAGLLTSERACDALAETSGHPEQQDAAYSEAIGFREALFRIFLAVIEKNTLLEDDLEVLNSVHRAMRVHLQFVTTSAGLRLTWSGDTPPLSLALWSIAESAGELLTSSELERVSLCAGPDCGWLFFDQSKNHSRKWCDSQDCGNRERVRRHYHQKKQVRDTSWNP